MSPSGPKMVPKVAWKAPGGQLGRPMWTRLPFKGALEEFRGPTLGPSWPQEGPWMRQRGATLQKRRENEGFRRPVGWASGRHSNRVGVLACENRPKCDPEGVKLGTLGHPKP